MLIGIDGSRAFGEGRTGTENYSFQLIRQMSLIDTENQYLIYIQSTQLSAVSSQPWPGNFEFKVIGLPRLWTQLGLAIRTFIDPIDVLFIPSHTLPLVRRPRLRTVITVHDLGAEYLPGLHQLKQILYLKLMTHYQIKTASRVIAVSESTKKDLVKRVGIRAGKVEVVYEGIDRQLFREFPIDIVNSSLKRLGLKRGNYFLFVGTIQPRKNLERLIKAFAIFSSRKLKEDDDFKLVLGGGKGWKTDEIYSLAPKLGIEKKVVFLGRISDNDLAVLYSGALALTYPSLFEGFGLPIIEAMALGCPVITSNLSSMPEVAGGAALLVNPYEESEIAEGMGKIYNDDTLRSSLIKKGNIRSSNFDWKTAAERTIEILTQAGV